MIKRIVYIHHMTDADKIKVLREALEGAAAGYMMNAKIDLETGRTKASAGATLDGGLKRVREALKQTEH